MPPGPTGSTWYRNVVNLAPHMADEPVRERSRGSLGSKMRTSFVTGLVVILPLFITFWLVRIVTGYLRSSLHGTFHRLFRLVAGQDLAASPY